MDMIDPFFGFPTGCSPLPALCISLAPTRQMFQGCHLVCQYRWSVWTATTPQPFPSSSPSHQRQPTPHPPQAPPLTLPATPQHLAMSRQAETLHLLLLATVRASLCYPALEGSCSQHALYPNMLHQCLCLVNLAAAASPAAAGHWNRCSPLARLCSLDATLAAGCQHPGLCRLILS